MKKRLMLAAVAAVVGVGGFAGFNAYQNNSSTSDIQLANAEALSNDELPTIPCRKSKTDHCSYFAYDGDGELGIVRIVTTHLYWNDGV